MVEIFLNENTAKQLLQLELPYFVLGIGHGAVKCPLLKLQVIHVQLLCKHASWWHSDLGGDKPIHVHFSTYNQVKQNKTKEKNPKQQPTN